MRLIRFYCCQDLAVHSTIELDTNSTKHAVQVLRLKTGDAITLFNGDALNYLAILDISGKRAFAKIQNATPNNCESTLSISLIQGISRSEKMDFTIQKATELGVTQIQPVFCRRSIVNLKGPRLEKKLKHWVSVIHSACEQSGRSTVPKLLQAKDITPFLEESTNHTKTRIMLDPAAQISFSELQIDPQGCELLIGPEGGFEAFEIDAARATVFTAVSLGPRILRTETAGIIACHTVRLIS